MKISIIYIRILNSSNNDEWYPVKAKQIYNDIFIIKEIDSETILDKLEYKIGNIVRTVDKKFGRWITHKIAIEKLDSI